ncbi:MAG: tRNA (N(6)-L-threonylcarbamoyladenosine(37)-C(2))-methylthiotransferase MtaB [Magnetococcales bacterium]|nr:tRNA (N(6)-L-threonylcarbamoyladenosine(37)-C(2))-methylthiotransferase MtaB [Magnetococcales bacterium]
MREQQPKRLAVVTLGCRVNQFESDLLQQEAGKAGFVPAQPGEEPDVVVVNTCSVTAESDRQTRQSIRRLARQHPGARIVAVGCSAQRDPAGFAALPGVVRVVGNDDKMGLPRLLAGLAGDPGGAGAAHEGEDGEPPRELPFEPQPEGFHLPLLTEPGEGRSRAYLQVQTGCDEQCTYCVIPALRGPSRSLSLGEALRQAETLIQGGCRELVLTGINLGAWGRDFSPASSLAALTRAVLQRPGLGRLRLSSLDPGDVDDELARLLGEHSKLCGHLHLSIQAGGAMVLKRMKRRHDAPRVAQLARRLRGFRPDLVLGADWIVGFPTESDAEFAASMALMDEAEIALNHVFRYSPRPGTPAAAIPSRFQVAAAVASRRSETLRTLGREVLLRGLRRRVGEREELLVETVEQGVAWGKTGGFLPLAFPALPGVEPGGLHPVRVVGLDEENLVLQGEMVCAKSP